MLSREVLVKEIAEPGSSRARRALDKQLELIGKENLDSLLSSFSLFIKKKNARTRNILDISVRSDPKGVTEGSQLELWQSSF